MLYNSDLTSLLEKWKEKAKSPDSPYKDGIWDCIWDLTKLMIQSDEEEANARQEEFPPEDALDFLIEQDAEKYLDELN